MNFTFKPDTSTISKYKPMQVYHHQRTIPSYFKTTDVQKDMLNDEYNIKICSALAGNFEGCIDWMFRKSYSMSDFAKSRKVPVLNQTKDRKQSMRHLPGRATMVFVSDLNAEELTKNCKRANAANSFPELYFVPVFSKNGDKHDTAAAIISYWIARYPDKHIVIFAKQIGSRSFSISQIDNVCIMISDPSFASAIQKMCRNQTPDMTDPDKKAHIYWYTLNNLTVNLCPLFEVVKQMSIYTSNNQFDRSFLDTVDIFIEVNGEEMNMTDMSGGSPYNDYLKSTANTFYRLSENFEYTTTNEQREKLYALFETLKADLTGVNGTSMSSKQAERDAQRMFDADKPETVFEGHTAAKVEKEQHEKKTEAEILERIVHIKNTIIAVAMRYGTHKSQSFNNFATDFSQITDNPLNPENVQILKQIYDKLVEYKILG